MGVLLGVIWFVVIVWNGVVIAKRQRRSGQITDYGHPIEDSFLLVGSAMVLIAGMLTLFWWLGPTMPEKHSLGRYLLEFAFLVVAVGITSLANLILRIGRKKKGISPKLKSL